MNELDLRKFLSSEKNFKNRNINNIFFIQDAANKAIKSKPDEISFKAPNLDKTKTIKVQNNARKDLIIQEIFYSNFIFLISEVEDYLSKAVRCLLLFDEKRLLSAFAGSKKEISIIEFIKLTRSEIIDQLINYKISNLFYASPKEQMNFYEKCLGIKVDKDIWNKYIEYKAIRDVLVHNNGVINKIFLCKCNNSSGYKINEKVIFNDAMFSDATAFLKYFVSCIYKAIVLEYDLPSNSGKRPSNKSK